MLTASANSLILILILDWTSVIQYHLVNSFDVFGGCHSYWPSRMLILSHAGATKFKLSSPPFHGGK